MKKLKINTPLWLFIACCLFFSPKLFGQDNNTTPPSLVIMDEDDGKNGGAKKLNVGESTEIRFIITLTNLVPLEQVREGIIYSIPSNYPPMALRYLVGSNSGNIPVDEFTFTGEKNGHSIFQAIVDIPVSFIPECQAGVSTGEHVVIHVTGTYTLVTHEESPMPYPIQPYSSANDIFSCEVFPETCGYCFPGCGDPITVFSTTIDHEFLCLGGIDGNGNGITNPGDGGVNAFSTNPNISNVLISPNPSYHSIQLDYNTEESSNGSIQIFDHTGKAIIHQTIYSFRGLNTEQIDLSQLEAGIYFGQLQLDNEVKPFKIIKLE